MRCFVRAWHDQGECQRTGRSLLMVAYQLSLETRWPPPSGGGSWLAPSPGSFPCDLVFYDTFARDRVRHVFVCDDRPPLDDRPTSTPLQLILAAEPLAHGHSSSHNDSPQRRKKVVFYDAAMRSRQSVLTVVVILAYALRPEDDSFCYPVRYGGSSDWARQAYVSDDYVNIKRPSDVQVVVELRQPLPAPLRRPPAFLDPRSTGSSPPVSELEACILSG
jgi:hypothetical protein